MRRTSEWNKKGASYQGIFDLCRVNKSFDKLKTFEKRFYVDFEQ